MFTTNLMLLMPVIGVAAGLVAAMLVVRARDLRLAPLAFNARNSRELVPQYTKEGVMVAMALPLAILLFGSCFLIVREHGKPGPGMPPVIGDTWQIPYTQLPPITNSITGRDPTVDPPGFARTPTGGGIPKPVPPDQAVTDDAGTQDDWARQANAGTVNPDQLKGDSVRVTRDGDVPSKGYVELAKQPELVKRIDPVYPSIVVKAGGQGRVYVLALLDIDGRVVRAEISRSSGNLSLDEAALAAVQQWVFTPAIAPDGRPTRVWQMCPINFTLN